VACFDRGGTGAPEREQPYAETIKVETIKFLATLEYQYKKFVNKDC